MLLLWLLWDDLPPSVLPVCSFSSPLRINFFPSHYPFPVSLHELRSAFSVPIILILLNFWSTAFGCVLWLCVCLTILFYASTVLILKPCHFLSIASARKPTRGSYNSRFLIPLYNAVRSLYIFHPNFFWHFSAAWVLSLCTAPMNQEPLLYPGNLRWSLANCLPAHSRERRSILFFYYFLFPLRKSHTMQKVIQK